MFAIGWSAAKLGLRGGSTVCNLFTPAGAWRPKFIQMGIPFTDPAEAATLRGWKAIDTRFPE
jgi:hypothetical protein